MLTRLLRQQNHQVRRHFSAGGHGPPPPSFVRLPAFDPTKPLPENFDMVWHDGVAPELMLDFEAQHVSQVKALAMFLSGLGCFAMVFVLAYFHDPKNQRIAGPRILDVDEALGPYPRRKMKYDPETQWYKPGYGPT